MSNIGLNCVPTACCFQVLFLTFTSHEISPSDKGKVADLITQVWKVMILRGCTLLLCTSCYYASFPQIWSEKRAHWWLCPSGRLCFNFSITGGIFSECVRTYMVPTCAYVHGTDIPLITCLSTAGVVGASSHTKPASFGNMEFVSSPACQLALFRVNMYEGWNFNSGNYLFTTDTK